MIEAEIFIRYATSGLIISITFGIMFIVIREIIDEYF